MDEFSLRLTALEEKVAELEARLIPVHVDESPEHAKEFLLEHLEVVDAVADGTWAGELYAWYCAWCVIQGKTPQMTGIPFVRNMRALGVAFRQHRVNNKTDTRQGVVYMVQPSKELRASAADVWGKLMPVGDGLAGALIFKRTYLNARGMIP